MKYLVSSSDFPNHPQPLDTEIAFVLIKQDTLLSFNSFGQRLGRLKIFDFEYIRVYFNQKEIILINGLNEIQRFRFDFRMLPKKSGYFEVHYSTDETYQIATNFWDKIFFRQNEQIIFDHYDFLVAHWNSLLQLDLTSKYNQENFLDIFAIIEINRFELTSNRLILRFYERLCKEMKYEIESGLKNKTFLSVGDFLYNELNQITLFQNLNQALVQWDTIWLQILFLYDIRHVITPNDTINYRKNAENNSWKYHYQWIINLLSFDLSWIASIEDPSCSN